MARQQAARARSKFSAAICSEGSAAAYDAWLLPAWRHAVSMCVRVDTSIIILVYSCYYVTQSDIVAVIQTPEHDPELVLRDKLKPNPP